MEQGVNIQKLAQKALEAMEGAYAPYSEFSVGAALLCEDQSIYTGCNIENASYSATVCAERTAFFGAISDKNRNFVAIAVAGRKTGWDQQYCPPCGVCRQVMAEFCAPDKFLIILVKSEEEYKTYKLGELLPLSFGAQAMRKEL